MITATRICKGCRDEKDLRAFVGARSYCRVCWHELSKADKEANYATDDIKVKIPRRFLKYPSLPASRLPSE